MPSRRPGGARMGCLALWLALGAFTSGCLGLITALNNRHLTSVTMAEFLRSPPDARWLELRDAVVFLPGAGDFSIALGVVKPSIIYVPVYASVPATNREPTNLLLETSDSDLVARYNALPSDSAQRAAYVSAHAEQLVQRRTITGVIQLGGSLDSMQKRALVRLAHSSDYTVLKDGARPDTRSSLALIALGLVLGLIGLWNYGKLRIANA